MANEQQQLNQVEWVDPQGSAPTPTPSSNERRWILPVAFATVVVVALVVAIVVVVGGIGRKGVTQQEVQNDMAAAEFDCQDARDVEKCLSNVAPRLAKDSGDIAYCKELEGDVLDQCLNLAAVSAQDPSACKQIKDTNRQQDCEDAVHGLTIQGDKDPSVCEDFHSDALRSNCLTERVLDQILSGTCDPDVVTDELCAMGAIFRAAVDAKNPDLCVDIASDYLRDRCDATVSPGDRDFDNLDAAEEESLGTSDTSTDSDGDGLMDGEEVHQYGTNPALADTDGDGFDDKTEIDNGFDPLS